MQFFDGLKGVLGTDGAGFVDGAVTDDLNQFGFLENCLGDMFTEAGGVDQGAEVLVVGQAQAVVVAVEPVDDGFQGEAGMEAGSTRIADDVAFGSGGGFGNGAKLAGEESEVSHLRRH